MSGFEYHLKDVAGFRECFVVVNRHLDPLVVVEDGFRLSAPGTMNIIL